MEPTEFPNIGALSDAVANPGFSSWLANDIVERERLEGLAIPRCLEWRNNNPDRCHNLGHGFAGSHMHPAPYCCSAYCQRCNGLRVLDGIEPPIEPNEWMHHG
jgi:hypothetical protein